MKWKPGELRNRIFNICECGEQGHHTLPNSEKMCDCCYALYKKAENRATREARKTKAWAKFAKIVRGEVNC